MDAAHILQVMKTYVQQARPEVDANALDDKPVAEVLASSFDVVEFVMHLEDTLEMEEEFDLEALAPKFAKLTFAGLAREVQAYLEAR